MIDRDQDFKSSSSLDGCSESFGRASSLTGSRVSVVGCGSLMNHLGWTLMNRDGVKRKVGHLTHLYWLLVTCYHLYSLQGGKSLIEEQEGNSVIAVISSLFRYDDTCSSSSFALAEKKKKNPFIERIKNDFHQKFRVCWRELLMIINQSVRSKVFLRM